MVTPVSRNKGDPVRLSPTDGRQEASIRVPETPQGKHGAIAGRKRMAADLVAMPARAGVAAEVVPPDGLNDFIRRQAAQLLDAAENCRLPELRAEWNRRRAPPSPNWTA